MKLILIILGFILLLGFSLWYVYDMKKSYKEEQDDFENPKHLKQIRQTKKMNIIKVPYNSQLKKVDFKDIQFNEISLNKISEPYYKDYSHHKEIAYKNYKSYDTQGFKDLLLQQISKILNDSVLTLMIITPREGEMSYDTFAYLESKNIVALHFKDAVNFKKWMNIIFKDQYENLQEHKDNGQFEIQPELNPNPQFMLTLAKGEFSQRWVNSGMMVDERPYESTGEYLYKKAPKKYNEAKIAKEKQNYIKKYINTSGSNIDLSDLDKYFKTFLKVKKLTPNEPIDNDNVYQKFENEAGFIFPEELKTLFKSHNGIKNTGFLTAEQTLTEWQNWKHIYDDWMLIDLTGNNDSDDRKTIGMYTNPYRIPFLSTGGGNFITIDYAPGNKGQSGQIIAFGADEIKIRFIAENMQDFLKQFIEGKDVLNNGFDK